MNQEDYKITQDAFSVIEKLAAICATPGITEETQKVANGQIQSILNSVISPAVVKLKAKGAGLLV